ncbi:hypothetical protein JFL43_02900 [Viridibacillus sp. YIM B01967]|uniref:DUF4367 domain-containing protein n=1 Tax=Viridibacillus soli TaxID=2798301 RepID=A0ABS1H333_9BACL|nr:hypothetical protein [Viridibacillus soli]MBK3493823.1 hypothetical protein [Viridibacillus soli]
MNNIKDEIQKITVPKEVHERTKLGAKKASVEQPQKRFRRGSIAVASAAVLGLGIMYSPIGEAMVDRFFEVTQFEKSKNNEEPSIGYQVTNAGSSQSKVYTSFTQVKENYNISIPLPEIMALEEPSAEEVEYIIGTNENNQFANLNYRIATTDRTYRVFATNSPEAKITFSAKTIDGTAIEKELLIDDTSVQLMKSNNQDGYLIYLNNNEWQLVISCFDRESNIEGVSDVTEEEIIDLVQSVNNW